jgi:hypothetical protein
MSMAIDVERVTSVLLPDGWYEVSEGSFAVGSYEYLQSGESVYWGSGPASIPSGFSYENSGTRIAGPLTTVLAVRYSSAKEG